jgi:hypothetical protein
MMRALRSAGSLLGSWRLELCLGKEKAGASEDSRKNCVNWNFISFPKFIWQNNWSTKNCLSWGKTSVFPRLCMEAKEYPRDLLGPSGCGGACT